MSKKIRWVNGNHMVFDSLHKTFNRTVGCISKGNVIGGNQYSAYVRPYNRTECNGFENAPGHLQEYDLGWILKDLPCYVKDYIRREGKTKMLIGYVLFHWNRGRKVFHGYVVTTYENKLMRKWYARNTAKTMSVVDEAVKYITD